jgi:hypothetical protein
MGVSDAYVMAAVCCPQNVLFQNTASMLSKSDVIPHQHSSTAGVASTHIKLPHTGDLECLLHDVHPCCVVVCSCSTAH